MDQHFHLRTEEAIMDTKLIRAVIDLIRAEEERRDAELPSENTNAAYDRHVSTDLPFVNELFLMLLVTIWHQIEKELICLAALVDGTTNEIAWDDYKNGVNALADKHPKERWSIVGSRLRLRTFSDHKTLELLQNLANSYKHDPFGRPGKKLLACLSLPTNAHYAPLPASYETAEGLCKTLGLDKAAGYADITEAFLKVAERFLIELESKTKPRPIKRTAATLNPKLFEG
jgi:hypothetical protein